MPKLLIFLAVWRRPEITEICFMGIDRLRKSGLAPIQALAVISEESMIALCEKYAIDYVMHPNEPLGKKKNFGIQQALTRDFDYMVEIGSDDLLKTEFLTLYPWGDKHVFGLRDFVMVNTETGQCRRHSERVARYGVGRAISKHALMSVDFLWHERLNRGLDNNSTFKLATRGFLEKRFSAAEPVALDLKSAVNIWPYNHFQGNEYPLEKALEGLSEQEINAIRCLVTKNKSADLIGA